MNADEYDSEAEAIVADAEPLDRDSLADGEVVAAIWTIVSDSKQSALPFNAYEHMRQNVKTDGNIFYRELLTALHVHDLTRVPEGGRNARFEAQLRADV
jgi:hypothetical protein